MPWLLNFWVKQVSFLAMRDRLRQLWQTQCGFEMMSVSNGYYMVSVSNGYYMVKFDSAADKEKVIGG